MNKLNTKDRLLNCCSAASLLIAIIFSPIVYAEPDRSDYDLDNDGLIEINDLSDLDEIRNNLDGKSLYGSSEGCPDEGCSGFELTQDLDFDTNQNGKTDENDLFWNANESGIGEGWEPIGSYGIVFSSKLEGNGYRILNLYINRPESLYVGLFGNVVKGELTGIGITGQLTSIVGSSNVGALIGSAGSGVKVSKSYSTGKVNGKSQVGGLIGDAIGAEVESCFTTGFVKGIEKVGGLAGEFGGKIVSSFSTSAVFGSKTLGGLVGGPGWSLLINDSYSTGKVSVSPDSGGLVGFSYKINQSIKNSYWAKSSSGQQQSFLESELGNYAGLSLSKMQCAIQGSTDYTNSDCISQDGVSEGLESGITLFNNWELSGAWTFGNEHQLPGLTLHGKVFRDADGDGVLDESDDAPNNNAYSIDRDEDGHPDAWSLGCDELCRDTSGLILDQFPFNDRVWLDLDLDGLVDFWPVDCNESCRENTGLSLDNYLNDTDNDGIENELDTDDNGDNKLDVDSDGDGLVEISTLEQLNAIRFQLDGHGYRASIEDKLDSSGCPLVLHEGHYMQLCKGYELIRDLNFDSNEDGVLDAKDQYWNENEENVAEGWLPIGGFRQPFSGVFEGNNHIIKNLYINRTTTKHIGLFGAVDKARLQNFGISGRLTKIVGEQYVGAIGGSINHLSTMKNVYNNGIIHGQKFVGGLVGFADSHNKILTSFNTGEISSPEYEGQYVGGLVGYLKSNNTIKDVFNSGTITGKSYVGGVLGFTYTDIDISSSYNVGLLKGSGAKVGGLIGSLNIARGDIQNSYWATDSSRTNVSHKESEENNYTGVLLSILQCATEDQLKNKVCLESGIEMSVFYDWNKDELNGESVWDFGDINQLPGLVINNTAYRDSDADGVLDQEDHWPQLYAAALDNDQDGYPDQWTKNCDDNCIIESGLTLDQFPLSAAGWKDEDLDGLLDEWAEDCDTQCRSSSGLDLDAMLADSNNDGVNNQVGNDDNGDGIKDADSDSNGLIEISNLNELNAIRFQLDGFGRRLTESGKLDSSGCPIKNISGVYQQGCRGYELVQDLNFDSDLNGYVNSNDDYWHSGRGWNPIGDDTDPFQAEFEGNNFSIKNLRIDAAYRSYSGLFGYINASRISNINLENVNLFLSEQALPYSKRAYSGALAAYVNTGNHIKNIDVSGMVTGLQTVGGVIGLTSRNNFITAVHNETLIIIEGDGYYTYDVGGVIGLLGSDNVLTGLLNNGNIEIKRVNSYAKIGGLVGRAWTKNKIIASLNSGYISSGPTSTAYVGGLVGSLGDESLVKSSYSTGHIKTMDSSANKTGGLIGNQDYSITTYVIENSYWLNNSSDPTLHYINNETTSHIGLPLSILQCAISANTTSENSDCVSKDGNVENLSSPIVLFEDWDTHELNGVPLWDFGNASQLPALNFNGLIKRDSDGDGVFDENDAFPQLWQSSVDSDKDGYPEFWTIGCDYLCQKDSGLFHDQFPFDPSVGKDNDHDGLVDEWSENCNLSCQESSSWELDQHLDDTDNDGVVNSIDEDDDNNRRLDVDRDHNGLIEITTLTQLNAMRYQLDGTGYRASEEQTLDQSGCPFFFSEGHMVQQCYGYELKSNLNFDTNNDGVLNVLDRYWNKGKGWDPIGKSTSYVSALESYTAHFDGNGYQIKHLYINRPTDDNIGLFGSIKNTVIKRVGLTGSMMSVNGEGQVGALAGELKQNVKVQECYSLGKISGKFFVGGLIGIARNQNIILNSFSSAKVNGESNYSRYFGGLIGGVFSSNHITNSFSTGKVSSDMQPGGLIGFSYYSDANNISAAPNNIENSYWAVDSSTQQESAGLSNNENYTGYLLKNLQCPKSANSKVNNESCFEFGDSHNTKTNPLLLYKNWDESIWNFGNEEQLPGLILSSGVNRDSDGDGLVDEDDQFPFDSDNDGFSKEIDAFPFNIAASVDLDEDGYPDAWNDNCDESCQIESGLILDLQPNDSDNDGVENDVDAFITNNAASKDTDKDGLPDTWLASCDASCQQDSGLRLDMDDDNDGVADESDAFPKNYEVSVDLDQDGFPDGWNSNCNYSCQASSNLELDLFVADTDNDGAPNLTDLFPNNSAASLDDDNDGLPDLWNEGCNQQCKEQSGLQLDLFLWDTDNDGVVNTDDAFEMNPAAVTDTDGDGKPDYWLESCHETCQENSELIIDSDDDNDGVEDHLDIFPTEFAASIDDDKDGFPDKWHPDCDLKCQNDSNLTLDIWLNDSDNDGSINTLDKFPQNANASIDNDNDGFPDYWHIACDLTCQNNSNLRLDVYLNDTDNDSVENDIDHFINDSAASLDTDDDGRPDDWHIDCDHICQANSELQVDEDDDNDGVVDTVDVFPLIFAASFDLDGDGFPDYWHAHCNITCQNESGLTLDVFLFDTDNDGIENDFDDFINNPAASIDTDGDGQPDQWNTHCNLDCQMASKLILDEDDDNDGVRDENDAFSTDSSEFLDTDGDGIGNNADQDDDNDGVLDKNDSDIAHDNGLPVLIQVPDDLKLQVTSEDGAYASLSWTREQYSQFRAYDVVDSYEVTYEAKLNGSIVDTSNDAVIKLPSGHLELLWRAKDKAGNYSDSLSQIIDVYPLVKFSQIESTSGDESQAEIEVELTGEPPEYPVIIEFKVNRDESDRQINQEDFSEEFDIESVHEIVINRLCNSNCINLKGNYQIPISKNTTDEVNEQVSLELIAVYGAPESTSLFTIDNKQKEHLLTIAYGNLAPEVNLILERNGAVLTSSITEKGTITVKAIVNDQNDSDKHEFEWDLGGITDYTILQDTVHINTHNLSSGDYPISVRVSDLVEDSLSDTAKTVLTIDFAEKDASLIGSMNGLWLLLLALLLVGNRPARRLC